MSEVRNLYPTLGYQDTKYYDIPREIENRERANKKYQRDQEILRQEDEDRSQKRMTQTMDDFIREAGRIRSKSQHRKLIDKYRKKFKRNGWGDFGISSVSRANDHFLKLSEPDEDEEDGVSNYFLRFSGKNMKENLEYTADSEDKMNQYLNQISKSKKPKASSTQLRLAKEQRDEAQKAYLKSKEKLEGKEDPLTGLKIEPTLTPDQRKMLKKEMEMNKRHFFKSAAEYIKMRDEALGKDTTPKFPSFKGGNRRKTGSDRKDPNIRSVRPKGNSSYKQQTQPDIIFPSQDPTQDIETVQDPVSSREPVENRLARRRFPGGRRAGRNEPFVPSNIKKYGEQPERLPPSRMLPSKDRIIDVELKPRPKPAEPQGELITPDFLVDFATRDPGLDQIITQKTQERYPQIRDWKHFLKRTDPETAQAFVDAVTDGLNYTSTVDIPGPDLQIDPGALPSTPGEQAFDQDPEFREYAVQMMPMLGNPQISKEILKKQLKVLFNLFQKEKEEEAFLNQPIENIQPFTGGGGGGGDFLRMR